MLILGLETSCDESASAVVSDDLLVRSNVIATQHDLHAEYGGVVPEIASRAHLERLAPTVETALHEAGVGFADIDAIAVGHRPGLIGSLLVGVSAAKALSWSLERPLVGVDHIAAHLTAALLREPGQVESDESTVRGNPEDGLFPALGLVVSGGHTSLFYMESPHAIALIGRTIDDAAGEAFDKAATILQIGYPGGPHIDALARKGNDRAVDFPVADLGRDSIDFSFSGLKTALLYAVRGNPVRSGNSVRFPRDGFDLDETTKADLAASFQRAVVSALMRNINRALDRLDVKALIVGGGVSANSRLRQEAQRLSKERSLRTLIPRKEYCLDNAAMIAAHAVFAMKAGCFSDLRLSAATSSAVPVVDFSSAVSR